MNRGQLARDQRWEAVSEWPLTFVAVLFLGAYAWPILDTSLAPAAERLCQLVTVGAWLVFAVDYVARLGLAAGHRRAFVRTNLVDLTTVVLPILRPLRLLRLVRILSVLNRAAGHSLRGRVATYVVGSAVLVIFVAALAELDAERGRPGANIETFGDAVWWAMTTVSTVGYGDHFPVTGAGRLVAVGLMLAGIALLGVVTATFASWLIDRVSAVEERAQAATSRDLAALTAEITALRAQLEQRDVERA